MANTFNIVWSGPKLDGKLDYSYWETLMYTHLKAQNLWNFIEPGLQEGADAAQQRRDQLALSQIHQGVDYMVFGKIANAKSAKEAWNTLKLSYKGVDKAQKAKLPSLRREYERYEMSSSETVEQYFTRVTDLVNKMRVYGEDMPDSKVVEKILRTMPMKYDHVVTTILKSHDMDTMTIAELQGTMESHISRILEKSEKSTEEALKSRVNFNNVAESNRTQEGRGRGFNFQSRGRGSLEVEVVAITTKEVTTILHHLIKEEVERISGLSIKEEVEEIFIKKEPISTAFIVESMDTKQQIADSKW
ncbi:uncharacterized protein LOC107483482 [Arachis duranensis]|uniref:Uncharacterized protein LOC107483482 n=1 Tax=Arachis duranensis TaxID=130453 RepID=A0A6P4CZM2_ARADU|nr:uncharacterized protein LOC107483482 [Arachis duranensis]